MTSQHNTSPDLLYNITCDLCPLHQLQLEHSSQQTSSILLETLFRYNCKRKWQNFEKVKCYERFSIFDWNNKSSGATKGFFINQLRKMILLEKTSINGASIFCIIWPAKLHKKVCNFPNLLFYWMLSTNNKLYYTFCHLQLLF